MKLLKKEVEELEKKNKRLEDGIVDSEKVKTDQKRFHTRYKEVVEKQLLTHAGEVKTLNSKVTELNEQIVVVKKELASMNPIIDAHVEQKTRLLEENDRILHENQNLFEENKRMVEENQRLLGENKGLLEEDKNNKQMLAGWKIQREVLTHIMAGTMPVDHAELSKARKSVSAYMNPATLQGELKKVDSDRQPIDSDRQEVPRTIRAHMQQQLGIHPEQEAPRPIKRSLPGVSDEAMGAIKAFKKK